MSGPEITADCCEVWPRILHAFRWMAFADFPELRAMPHVHGADGTDWRVNHCPACGVELREVVVEASRIAEERG